MALRAKHIAQSGTIPNTHVAAHMLICMGLTPASLKHSLAQSHQGPGVGRKREALAMQGALSFGDTLCAKLTVESPSTLRMLCKKAGVSSSRFVGWFSAAADCLVLSLVFLRTVSSVASLASNPIGSGPICLVGFFCPGR